MQELIHSVCIALLPLEAFCSILPWSPATMGFWVRIRLQVGGAAAASPDALLQGHEQSGAQSGGGLTARPQDTLLRKQLQLLRVHRQTHMRLQTSFLVPPSTTQGHAATVAERAPTAASTSSTCCCAMGKPAPPLRAVPRWHSPVPVQPELCTIPSDEAITQIHFLNQQSVANKQQNQFL